MERANKATLLRKISTYARLRVVFSVKPVGLGVSVSVLEYTFVFR